MSETEMNVLSKTFSDMGLEPDTDSPEKFAAWMAEYIKTKGGTAVKSEYELPKMGTHYSTKMSPTVALHTPRISTFSGDSSKGDIAYDLWNYEVRCLIQDGTYSNETIATAIRKSLKGDPARIVKNLGPGVPVENILRKLDNIYGFIDEKEDVLSEFYSAKQKDNEDVATWGCRLSNIISKAVDMGQVSAYDSGEMLRCKFYKGLKPSLKSISRHKFETIGSYDDLLLELRKIENEQKEVDTATNKKSATAKLATATTSSELSELKGMMSKLTSELGNIKERLDRKDKYKQFSSTQMDRGRGGFNQRGWRGRGQSFGHNTSFVPNLHTEPSIADAQREDNHAYISDDVICYRCGQRGHIKIGCRVILDHSRRGLNGRRPMGRGRP